MGVSVPALGYGHRDLGLHLPDPGESVNVSYVAAARGAEKWERS
jgi:hypothetical protein